MRRASSRVANHVRSRILKDGCLDTGCSLKLFRRDLYLLLPQFNHMHRFLPALFAREGVGIINVPVSHRPRSAGESKYGVGNRLWVGIADMFGVRWLTKRGFRLSGVNRLSLEETVDKPFCSLPRIKSVDRDADARRWLPGSDPTPSEK